MSGNDSMMEEQAQRYLTRQLAARRRLQEEATDDTPLARRVTTEGTSSRGSHVTSDVGLYLSTLAGVCSRCLSRRSPQGAPFIAVALFTLHLMAAPPWPNIRPWRTSTAYLVWESGSFPGPVYQTARFWNAFLIPGGLRANNSLGPMRLIGPSPDVRPRP
jgi:hypothetical protein